MYLSVIECTMQPITEQEFAQHEQHANERTVMEFHGKKYVPVVVYKFPKAYTIYN